MGGLNTVYQLRLQQAPDSKVDWSCHLGFEVEVEVETFGTRTDFRAPWPNQVRYPICTTRTMRELGFLVICTASCVEDPQLDGVA